MPLCSSLVYFRKTEEIWLRSLYRGADKSLARPTSLSIFFLVQGTGRSTTGPDPENRVGDQDVGSRGRPVSSGLQVPGEPFPSGRAKDLSAVSVCPPISTFKLLAVVRFIRIPLDSTSAPYCVCRQMLRQQPKYVMIISLRSLSCSSPTVNIEFWRSVMHAV
jgi:hypothetical protein